VIESQTHWIHHPDKRRIHVQLMETLSTVFRPSPTSCFALKPNLCSASPAHEGVITDLELTRCVLAYLLDHRVAVRLVELPPHLRDVGDVFRRSGYDKLAREYGVALINPEERGGFSGRGALLPGVGFGIARSALDTDGVINLPKVKTHRRAFYSGAVKNLMGLTDMRTRHLMHLLGLQRTLVDLYRAIGDHVVLNVADAVVAMEGDGPTRGDAVRLDSVVVDPDAVRLDCQVVRQVGLGLHRIPYLEALRAEPASPDLRAPIVVGEPLPPMRLRPIPERGVLWDYFKELLITQPQVRRLLQRLNIDRLANRLASRTSSER